MKFLHTADLHIGKKIFEQSLIEDQAHILDRIYEIALEEQVEAVVIAGDVYDRAIPPVEAVALLDSFLTRLVQKRIPVIAVSGNHDSAERLSFGEQILEKQGLYLAGACRNWGPETPLKTVTLEDAYGPVSFVCLPFVKPAMVGASDSARAVETLLGRQPIPSAAGQRNVLVTHFFVTGENGENPEISDSEADTQVGGLDAVPVSLLQSFDYVALGHIHKPQHIGRGNAYYAGSPLKYSFSEAQWEKSVNIIELAEPGNTTVRKVPLAPLRDMRMIRGRLQELMEPERIAAEGEHITDYLQINLTDREELIDPMGALRSVYPNVLFIHIEKNTDSQPAEYISCLPGKRKSTAQLFGEFYEMLKGEPMDERRLEIVKDTAEEAEAENRGGEEKG